MAIITYKELKEDQSYFYVAYDNGHGRGFELSPLFTTKEEASSWLESYSGDLQGYLVKGSLA